LLQNKLVKDPECGNIIPGSGGLRKVRWSLSGRGKRSGSRIIYYWCLSDEKLLMLFAYAKNERDNLSQKQLKILRKIVEEEFK
jgi:hypothetical protein